jgi:very-short-patch-repair endonuclease
MLLDVIREFGLPMPVRNYPVVHEGVVIAELDLAYLEPMIDLEANGDKWHSTRRQVARDAERSEDLRSIDWNVVGFGYDEVVHHPEVAAARIRAALCASTHRIGV